jgi:hypothetical protein
MSQVGMLEALTQMKIGTQSRTPLVKLVVMFSVYKKQKDRILICSSSKTSALMVSTLLKFCHPMVLQGVSLLLGKAVSLVDN